MNKISSFFKQEFSGWKKSEILFFLAACLAILVISVYSGDTVLGLMSSITGVAYTLCNGKGKRIAYIFGFINSALFAYIAFQNTIYGDATLYGIYYVPAMIVGFFSWSKNFDTESLEIYRKKMTTKGRIILVLVCILSVLAGGIILSFTDDVMPFIDSFTTVIQIIATVLAIRRYYEQWFLWTSANAVEVILWAIRSYQGAENATVSLAMFIVFFIIGIKMWIDWSRKV